MKFVELNWENWSSSLSSHGVKSLSFMTGEVRLSVNMEKLTCRDAMWRLTSISAPVHLLVGWLWFHVCTFGSVTDHRTASLWHWHRCSVLELPGTSGILVQSTHLIDAAVRTQKGIQTYPGSHSYFSDRAGSSGTLVVYPVLPFQHAAVGTDISPL